VRAGTLNKRARFEAPVRQPDGAGGAETLSWSEIMTVWVQFSPERARERVESGRVASAFAGVLRFRSSSMARTITQEHRVVLDGVIYNIRSLSNPDQRNDMIEAGIETDGAAG